MVLSCGSLHRGLCRLGASHVEAAGVLLRAKGGRQEQGGEEDPFAAPNPVLFHSAELLVYSSAAAARLSTGLICHPIKSRTALVHTEWGVGELVMLQQRWRR